MSSPAGVVNVRIEREAAMVPTADATGVVGMFERFMRDQSVDIGKFGQMMELWERMEAKRAAAVFSSDMVAAQTEMVPVAKDAWNPQTKSRYASYEALDLALRPTYTKHGFGLTFDTAEGAPPDCVRVVCDVVHKAGHVKRYQIDMPADGKGAKGGDVMTRTHATGAAVSYGQRYLLKMIFNIATADRDTDGNGAEGKPPAPPEPKGFGEWWERLQDAAMSGTTSLEAVWQKGQGAFKQFVVDYRKDEKKDLWHVATKADAAARGK